MKTYALIHQDTGRVVEGTSGPFDGETLEDAENEVINTVHIFMTDAFRNADRPVTAHKLLSHRNVKLVELTIDLAAQYEKAE